MDGLILTLNGKPRIISIDEVSRVIHSKVNMICGHYKDNVIKKEYFIKSNCLIVKKNNHSLVANCFKPLPERFLESQSKFIFHLNWKTFFYIVQLESEITDFADYINVLKSFSHNEKICFGYQFSGLEKFIRPSRFKERADDFPEIEQKFKSYCNEIGVKYE